MYNMISYMKHYLESLVCYNVGAWQSGMYSGNGVPLPLLSHRSFSDCSLIGQSGSLQSLTLSLTQMSAVLLWRIYLTFIIVNKIKLVISFYLLNLSRKKPKHQFVQHTVDLLLGSI